MANKSVIDIDVNDAKFREFYKLYLEFDNRIKGSAEKWSGLNSEIRLTVGMLRKVTLQSKDINEGFKDAALGISSLSGASEEAAKGFKDLNAELNKTNKKTKKLGEENVKNNKGMKVFYNLVKKTGKGAKRIAISFKNAAKSIYKMGKGLAAFGLIGASLSGIATLWGLRELANSAVTRQRTARGLGDTPGRVAAFKTDYGRYINPGMLNNIVASQGNLTGRMWLSQATGKPMSAVQSMRPTQIAQLAIMAAKRWWESTPKSIRTQEYARTKGFAEAGLSWQDIRRIGATSMGALRMAGNQFRQDSSAFGFSNRSAGQWYTLSRQFSVAGNTIESMFTKKLAGLATPLSGLIKSITNDFTALVNSELTPQNIKDFGEGFHNVAKFMGSKEFISSIKHFGTVVGQAANMIGRLVNFFGPNIYNETTVPVAHEDSLAEQLRALRSTPMVGNMPGKRYLPLKQEDINERKRIHSFLYPNDVNVNITNGTGGDLSTSINGLY